MAQRPEGREKTIDGSGLFWTIQPPLGLIKGAYFRAENRFGQVYNGATGYRGVLQVVHSGGRLLLVEFDELNSPEYYIRMHQNLSKRYSDYGFFQATKARTAQTGVVLAGGIAHLERQMQAQNRLTGGFDLLTGASNSINRSMLPLAQAIAARLEAGSRQRYYGLARRREDGLTPRLQVVAEDGRILSCRYDEIFADTPEEIADPELKQYHRQSKYHAPAYVSTCAAAFSTVFDLVEARVLETGRLDDLGNLPFQDGPRRCTEYDGYLALARALRQEMEQDGAL